MNALIPLATCVFVICLVWILIRDFLSRYSALATISPVFLDGTIYVLIQMLTVLSTQFGTDEAAKYISATPLFWIKIVIGELAAGALAVKMFRSQSYADHLRKKEATSSWARVEPPITEPPTKTP